MSELISTIDVELVGFILGITGGVVASFLTLYLLRFIKPKVEISDVALLGNDGCLRIKLVNRSKRQVVNIEAAMVIFERSNNGLLKRIVSFELKRNAYTGMDGKHTADISWNLPFAYTFATEELKPGYRDIWTFLNASPENTERRLGITYKFTDAISGTTIVNRRTYTPGRIKKGKFGNDLTIK